MNKVTQRSQVTSAFIHFVNEESEVQRGIVICPKKKKKNGCILEMKEPVSLSWVSPEADTEIRI